MANLLEQAEDHQSQKEALILRRLPPSLSIDSAHTPTNRPLTLQEQDSLALLNRLKEFLATAPTRWSPPDAPGTVPFPNPQKHPALNRFALPSGEYVTCVLWDGLYHITGTDIVRAMVFRFEAFGRPVRNMKKFEEGIFSDLRNLKPGTDACLEEPKSPFLDLLYKYQCIRTQKKQKVFYWFSVPHDRLFLDALERDLKREKIALEPATALVGEPALSFKYDGSSGKSLWEEWCAKVKGLKDEGGRNSLDEMIAQSAGIQEDESGMGVINSVISSADRVVRSVNSDYAASVPSGPATSTFGTNHLTMEPRQQFWGGMLELFEGSPSYKQRRKKRVPTQSRLKEKDRGRGVRKGSKDPEDERDSSAGVTPTTSATTTPISQSASEPGRQRVVGSRGEIELARRELQETLAKQTSSGLPAAADSPGSINLSESRSSASSPDQEQEDRKDPYINAPSANVASPARSQSFGGTSTQAPLIKPAHQHHPHGVNPRLYHPYYTNHPTGQHRHTLPTQVGETSSQRPSSSHVVPHHSQTLPPNMHLGNVPSTANVVAFICPLQQCRRLFTHAELWKGHVEQHNIDGLLPSLDMRAALSFRVTLPAGSHLEEGQTEMAEPEEVREAGQCHTPPIQVENAHFAYAPPDTRITSTQPTGSSSLSVSPVPWAGGRPRSAGYSGSPGSNYSGPPSSHSPSPPNEPVGSTNAGMRGTLDIPRAQAYSSLSLPQQHQATSAPSYKHSFDHATIYPQGLSPSPVMITRPRSAVPHLTREVEDVSRPGTSVSYNGGPGYFHDNSPAEASPVVNFSPYPPSSAVSSNFSGGFPGEISRNTLSSSPVLNISTYQEPLQYDHSPEASASLPDFEEAPDMEMDASGYSHHDHLGTTITNTNPLHIVESELEYPPSERRSPPDLWNTNYTSSDHAKETYTHLPIVTVDPVTGMTTEEAIQLFS